jgi:hypothetical protein
MPTVLDHLRTHLIGDEAADRLEQVLAALNARLASIPVTAVPVRSEFVWPAPSKADQENPILKAMSTPSPGYEPLLTAAGWNQLAARGVAKIAVRHGRRRALESKLQRPVVDAIRFLALRKRQRRAVLRCAKIILAAWRSSTVIESMFASVNVDECKFMRLLEDAVDNDEIDYQRITDSATVIASRLSVARGPKVSAASAAYEFILNPEFEFSIPQCRHPTYPYGRAEYINALTAATRLEFNEPNFDPRPAQRRTARKGRNSLGK